MREGLAGNRRDFLRIGGSIAALNLANIAEGADGGWEDVPRILARIKAPVFPNRRFDVARYGAVGDGKTDCSAAIAKAIGECNSAGGGRVTFPAGVFFTGPVHLKSNVELNVPTGATLLFTRDTTRYLPAVYARWEGVECMTY